MLYEVITVNMPDRVQELMVFPTEIALRRYQQDRALAQGFVDASGHTTFARLRSVCLPYAKMKGRRMDAANRITSYNVCYTKLLRPYHRRFDPSLPGQDGP